MYYAVQSENIEIVKALLDAGADPNLHSPSYLYYPLAEAVRYESHEIRDLLIQYGADTTGMHTAFVKGKGTRQQ